MREGHSVLYKSNELIIPIFPKAIIKDFSKPYIPTQYVCKPKVRKRQCDICNLPLIFLGCLCNIFRK